MHKVLLKRVDLAVASISNLSVLVSATAKETVMKIDGTTLVKDAGGKFNFEIVKRNTFAVAFSSFQGDISDFTSRLFQRNVNLFDKLQDATVSELILV